MRLYPPLRKAPWCGAFFVLAVALGGPPGAAADCPGGRTDEAVAVRHVYDGDTLILSDNRRLRLIGVNTPELGRDGAADEPLALAARDRLRRLVFDSGQRVRLRYGPQRLDRHGRTLAHLFLADGSNVSARLLEQGLGWALAIPPNLWGLDCYRQAEETARRQRRGVWSLSRYRPAEAARLDLRSHGFRLVQGRITRVADSRSARWINLQGRFAVRIPRADLAYFEPQPSSAWIGRRVEVRGWVYRARGELRLNLHHPGALRTLPAQAD